MRLSTSSSEPPAGPIKPSLAVPSNAISSHAGIVTLLGGLLALCVLLETLSPIVLHRLSGTEQRVVSECKQAMLLRRLSSDGTPTLLVTGNSLLLEGVDITLLRKSLAERYAVSRLGIEQTHYLDWYFGLSRMFQEGARPSTVVVTLSTLQLASDFTLGESFARRQMSTRDFFQVVSEAKLDSTTASTYLLAHWSDWLASKAVLRKDVLIGILPSFRELSKLIVDRSPRVSNAAELLRIAQTRLPKLNALCRANGVKLLVLIPPSQKEDHSREVQEIGRQAEVTVMVPSKPGEYPPSLYRDGFHLNAEGASIFTQRLAEVISAQ